MSLTHKLRETNDATVGTPLSPLLFLPDLISPTRTVCFVLKKDWVKLYSYSVILEAALLKTSPRKLLLTVTEPYTVTSLIFMYAFRICINKAFRKSSKSWRSKKKHTHTHTLSAGLDMWFTMRDARGTFWVSMKIIMFVQICFDYFTSVIGTLVAEIIVAFSAMETIQPL